MQAKQLKTVQQCISVVCKMHKCFAVICHKYLLLLPLFYMGLQSATYEQNFQKNSLIALEYLELKLG